MARFLLLALTNPVPGREDEFNDWYENVALPMYRSIPGVSPIGRYRLVDAPKMFPFQMDSQWDYMSVYEIEAEDFSAFAKNALATIEADGSYYFSDAIDKTRFFEPIFRAI